MSPERSELPVGRVTFVCTDIEGSTRLLRQLGEGYPAVLEAHRALLRSAWERHGGHEVDATGDAFFVAFDDSAAAVIACGNAQRALLDHVWPAGADLRVRMGVHAGLAAPHAGAYVALAVHEAARVAATAHGGQVVVSEQAAAEAGTGCRLRPLGRYRVRDFERPVQLLQLLGPRLPASFPPPRALPAEGHNLAVPRARLIGRDDDLRSLVATVTANRYVCVTGPGGVGKTRLVTEFGLRHAGDWPDGVWLADISPLSDPALLPRAVARALGLHDADRAVWGDVVDQLRARRCLLVLDGCEHHADSVAALVAHLLAAAPRVHVVVTSTRPLHLTGEMRWRLAPLPAGEVSSPAVALFEDRARAARPGFSLDATTGPVVLDLCHRLDGLPLAVEIVAALSGAMSPAEIARDLDRCLLTMRMRDRARPARHQAMQAVLDWSVGLLDDDELELLTQISVLPDSFDLATAAAAAGGPAHMTTDVAIRLWSLIDKSLLFADLSDGPTRYRSLATVRSYAASRLSAADRSMTTARLAHHYVATIGPANRMSRQWVQAVALGGDNLRAVLRSVATSQPQLAQELACTLARHHDAVQSYRAGIDEVGDLARELAAETPARVGLLTALGDLHVRMADTGTAATLAAEAAEVRKRTGAPSWDEVGVEKLTGEVALYCGEPQVAATVAAQALQRPLSTRAQARMHNLRGIALASLGDYPGAMAEVLQELRAAAELDDEVLLAHAHGNAAETALRLGALDDAASHQQASLTLALVLGRPSMIAYSLIAAGQLAVAARPVPATHTVAVHLVRRGQDLLAATGAALYATDAVAVAEFSARAVAVLGDEAFASAAIAGAELSVEAAIRLCRDVLGPSTAEVAQI